MAFPTSIPTAVTISSSGGDNLNTSGKLHDTQHNNDNTDIIGLATKMGTGASTPTTGTRLVGNGTGTSAWAGLDALVGNPIINGEFRVAQRGTSLAMAAATNAYVLDRWRWVSTSAAVHTVSQSSDVPSVAANAPLGSASILLDCTTADASIAAGDYTALEQHIEGHNWAPFAQRAFVLSFWVKATATGTHCVAFRNNGAGTPDRTYVGTYTVDVTATWEYKTILVSASPSAGTWNYTSGAGLTVAFTQLCGSTFQTTAGAWQTGNYYGTSGQTNQAASTSNDFRLAFVKIEAGSVATPFESRSFGAELALCQRYYAKTFPYGTAPAQSAGLAGAELVVGYPTSGATIYRWFFPVTMRTTPTLTTYNPSAANTSARNATDSTDTAVAAQGVNNDRHAIWASSTAGDAGDTMVLHATAAAEL